MTRAAYYLGNSCDANIRTRHPDGGERPCAKTASHVRVSLADRLLGDLVIEGPFRDFFCDQHTAEHDAGQNVFDPERPSARARRAKAEVAAIKARVYPDA
jgi:hypothetical protein